jgi:hypothetical protein
MKLLVAALTAPATRLWSSGLLEQQRPHTCTRRVQNRGASYAATNSRLVSWCTFSAAKALRACIRSLSFFHRSRAHFSTGSRTPTSPMSAWPSRDKEAETALEIQGRRCRDKISLGNSANSGLIARFREISGRPPSGYAPVVCDCPARSGIILESQ